MSLLGGGCHSGLLGIAALFEHQTIKSNSKSNYSVLASVMEKHGIGSYMYSTVPKHDAEFEFWIQISFGKWEDK